MNKSSGRRHCIVAGVDGLLVGATLTDFEKRLIESTLEAAGGVQKRAAELLHIKPTTLNEMIKRYEIRPRRKRTMNGNGGEPVVAAPAAAGGGDAPLAPSVAGPLTPAFDDK